MMSMEAFPCEEIEPLLPAAAAGALDRDEQAVVQAHVLDCARCLPRLAEYESVVEQLAYAVPQVAPPPDLLPRLMQAVQATGAQPAPAPGVAPVPAPQRSPARPLPDAPAAPRRGLLDALLGAYRQLAPAGFALALLLVAVVGAWGLTLNSQVDKQREMIAMLRMPDSQAVAMQPMTTTTRATAQVYMAPGHEEVGLVVQHLMPQPGRVYQLWLIMPGGRVMPCGTVQVDDHGVALGMIRLPADPAQSIGVMITDESSPQPQVPTGTKWLEARYEQ
jgi:hypothetical protein